MGFDLSGKQEGYFRASVYQMILLRCAMTAAGVKPELVYKKFVSNNNYFVTPLQAQSIASKLGSWLKGRNLTLDVSEKNERARISNKAYFSVLKEIGTRADREKAMFFSTRKSLPVRLDSGMRKGLRTFADFCESSGGFWVG